MLIGVAAGLVTCALWGLSFVAPLAVAPYSTWDLTVARYVTFGLVSALLMLHPRLRPTGLSPRRAVAGLLLGGFGYVAYFLAAAFAVQWAGAAIPPVVVGTMPVVLALIGNWRERSLPWSRLALPLAAIAAGVTLVNVATLDAAAPGRQDDILLGTLFACLSLGIWIVYGLINAAVMRSADAPDGLRWTGLQGLGAALFSLPLLPLATFGAGLPVTTAQTLNFAGWVVLMGVVGSWLATAGWMIASRRLPLALAAQLIVAETVFGLLYGFLYEGRWPTRAELAGCGLQIAGVVAATLVFSRDVRSRTRASGGPGQSQPATGADSDGGRDRAASR